MWTLTRWLEIYKCIVLTAIALLLAGSWVNFPLKVRVMGGFVSVDGSVDVGNTVDVNVLGGSVDVDNWVDVNVKNTVNVDGTVSIRR